MNTSTLTLLLRFAGLLHLGLLCAGLMMPGVVGLRAHLAQLPSFIRRLFWVYYAFIGLCLVSFGILTFVLAGTLAEGSALARALCAVQTGKGVVLLDEPTAQLDVRGEAEIFDRVLAASRRCTSPMRWRRKGTRCCCWPEAWTELNHAFEGFRECCSWQKISRTQRRWHRRLWVAAR